MSHMNTGFMVFGLECEIDDLSPSRAERALSDAGLDAVWITTDASNGVSAEIVFPPLPFCTRSKNFVGRVYETLENAGATISVGCGHHVHFSASQVTNCTMDEFYEDAINRARNTSYNDANGAKLPSGDLFGDAMPFELVKDVVYRYGIHQDEVNRILPNSRHDNRMCPNLYGKVRHNNFDGIRTMGDLNAHLGGKFSAINVSTYNTHGTIEFRQHSGTLNAHKIWGWIELIHNMFMWSDNERLEYNAQASTDIQPFRPSCRNGVAWSMCRTSNGASVAELMNAIGWTPNNVRRTISEWRARFGDDVVQTIGQQNNGASYGDGDTHTRYIIRETIGNSVSIIPANRAGQTSIWAGLSDECFEYMQERIQELSR
jgi:hypothetical protein